MKVLIFGQGFIGKRAAASWPNAILSPVRIDNEAALRAEIERVKPDVILNAAGVTGKPNVDWCETHQSETMQGNVVAPLILARVCQDMKIYMLHLGTGCVFYGPSPDPKGWRENDFANPISFYSRSKYAADLMLSRLPNVGIARFRMPIDAIPGPTNLIDKLARYTQVIDVENSVTIVEDLINTCYALLEKRTTGVFHVVNPGIMRHKELLRLYREHVDPSHSCEWITAEELVAKGLATKTRSNCIMQSERLNALGITLRPIDEALVDTMKKYAQAKRGGTSSVRRMKGVITAGGTGSRLAPLTTITNKHLLPIYNQPMILYPIQTLVRAGVRDIMLITGPEYAHAFIKLLGSGSAYGCHITYRIQDLAGGIAQAVGMASDFVGTDNCVVHLGDNIFHGDITPHITSFEDGARIFYKEVPDAKQYGVVEVDETGKVLSIEEKPAQPKSPYAQTGLYVYSHEVFDIISKLKPSGRGELEISDVNTEFLRRGKLEARELTGEWFDTGTFRDLKRASDFYQHGTTE